MPHRRIGCWCGGPSASRGGRKEKNARSTRAGCDASDLGLRLSLPPHSSAWAAVDLQRSVTVTVRRSAHAVPTIPSLRGQGHVLHQ
jgi:hypothetical protein